MKFPLKISIHQQTNRYQDYTQTYQVHVEVVILI